MDRDYEALIILKAAGTEAELAQSVAQLEDPIKKLGGRIDNSVSWGRRRLAYRIAHQSEGQYHLLNFQLAPAQLAELKRLLRLNEHIVRFLILNRSDHHEAKSPEKLAQGSGFRAPRPAERATSLGGQDRSPQPPAPSPEPTSAS